MLTVLRYGLMDTVKNPWLPGYALLFFALSGGLAYFTGSSDKSVATLLNVILLIVPAVSLLFSTVFFYNSASYREILLSQPIGRNSVFLGSYCGFTMPMAAALVIGMLASLPFYPDLSRAPQLATIAAAGVTLTFVLAAIGFLIGACNDDRMRGFTTAVLCWLYFCFIHDGLILLVVSTFSDFRIEYCAAGLSLLDPITMARVLVMLNFDVAALMGCSGTLIRQLLGSAAGLGLVSLALLAWAALPIALGTRTYATRDL